jgi:AmmeMemoRadiSam system protein B/AmmeMemoRadiSam system protein A
MLETTQIDSMKKFPESLLSLLLAIGLAILFSFQNAYADAVRQPVWAGKFYPQDASELTRQIEQLTQKAQKSQVRLPADKALRALIMPHAGYIYSGLTAAHASLVLKRNQFSKVILIGPDHRIGIRNGAICDAVAYQTPLGRIDLHQDTARLRRIPSLFQSLPLSKDREHSLEVIVPFLQTYLGEFELVPIVVGRTDIDRFSDALVPLIEDDTLLVVSSDLSHYLSYSEAVAVDRQSINGIMNLTAAKLVDKDNRACGLMPLLILMDIARRSHWQPVFLHYSNSGDTAGGRSRVVGYTAVAFFGDQPMENQLDSNADFTEEQGQLLVKLARHTILDNLGRKIVATESDRLVDPPRDAKFQSHCGTFVTLKIHGQLRGCIGNLTSTETVWDGIKRNAINAAFHDPRFSPLTDKEFDQAEIEVSILTEPRPLAYNNGQDLIQKLRINVDGVIIRQGGASATFLPQVWEQLPQPEQFLSHLCTKAGLPSDAWKNSELEVLTYQVQYFEEN